MTVSLAINPAGLKSSYATTRSSQADPDGAIGSIVQPASQPQSSGINDITLQPGQIFSLSPSMPAHWLRHATTNVLSMVHPGQQSNLGDEHMKGLLVSHLQDSPVEQEHGVGSESAAAEMWPVTHNR